MKKYLSAIDELKMAYPNLQYEDGSLFNEDELISDKADELIEDHFENHNVIDNDGSNNPEMDFERKASSGKEYVEIMCNNNYEESFLSIN
jgi:hypothetical protein